MWTTGTWASCDVRLAGRSISSSRRGTRFRTNMVMTTLRKRGLRMAVVGSGPAGFYAAGKVMKSIATAKVDMYEKLPIPFGLVRYGVAPDHQEVKNCQDRFEEIAEAGNFEFIGNVDVGKDVSLSKLAEQYDVILFTYGASRDKQLGIPGEELDGIYSARDFVAWYNGMPGMQSLSPKLARGEQARIFGQGNVALDLARILLTNVDNLREYDLPEYALESLSRSKINSVDVIGRRGPCQAAFTIKEVRELVNMKDVEFQAIPRELFPQDLTQLSRPRKRLMDLLLKAAQGNEATSSGVTHSQDRKSLQFSFLSSPKAFQADEANAACLGYTLLSKNEYQSPSELGDPFAKVTEIRDQQITTTPLATSVAFRSIGYKAEPIPGMEQLGIAFDESKGIIPNQRGRIYSWDQDAKPSQGTTGHKFLPGLYVAGWVKRGPTGVIASTMEEAFQTADSIVEDFLTGKSFMHGAIGNSDSSSERSSHQFLQALNIRPVSWEDWKRLDNIEKERGKKLGKAREKITDVDEMLQLLSK